MIELRLLGAFTVLIDGRPVGTGGGRRADLLARLALAEGRPVQRERLLDDLWAGEAPATATSKVHAHVSGLRKLLGPGAIRTAPHGYALGADVHVDLAEWRSGLRQGLALADRGDDLAAMAALSLAAERWPGDPLAGLGDTPFLATERRALEALHLEGAERRAELRLKHGFLAATVADLAELVDRHPLHEGLLAQLVLGTAMTGRQVEALMLVDRARERLVDEFGLEPGPKLQEAQERVLRGILPARSTAPARATLRLGLPHLPDRLVGRSAEIGLLERLLAEPSVRLVTLTGLGGVGKTRLAQALVERRADSACWVGLADTADAAHAAEAIAEQLGVAASPGDAAAQLGATLAAAATPPLLVLDDLEHLDGVGRVVERLLLAAPALTVLATSRRPLGLRAERRVVVDALPLDPDDPEGAASLLLDRVRRSVPVDDADLPLLGEIAALCGGLPLALELAAARARLLPLPQLRDRLAASTAVLGGGSAVETAVSTSAALLPPGTRAAWAAASVFAGGFVPEALAAVRGTDLGGTLDDCERMLDLGLLRRTGEREEVRLELPPVVREAAGALLDEAERARLRDAHAARFVALCAGDAGFARLARERPNLRAALRHLQAAGDGAARGRLLVRLAGAWCALGDGAEMTAWIDALLDREDRAPVVRAELLLARIRAGGQVTGPEVALLLAEAEALAGAGDPPAELLWLQGRHALASGRPAQARDLADRLLLLPGGGPVAARLRALVDADPDDAVADPPVVGAAAEDPDAIETVLARLDALVAAGRLDEAARHGLAAVSATHPDDRAARCRLLVRIAAVRLLDGRVELARDSERGALRLLAASTWTREKLVQVLVAAAHLTWRGGRAGDAAFLVGLWTAGVAALGAAPAAAETMLLDRYLRRVRPSASPALAAARAEGERRVRATGVHAALEGVVQALLDGRALRREEEAPTVRDAASALG